MASRAVIALTGHCTTPEVKVLPDGTDVVSFSIATEAYSKTGNITSWWRVSIYGKRCKGLVTLMDKQLFGKGTLVSVVGEVAQRPYTANDGTERMSLDVRAYEADVHFPPRNQQAGSGEYSPSMLEEEESDLNKVPF